MIASVAWALVRDDPTRDGSEADQYVRREYGGPNAGWLLTQAPGPIEAADATYEAPVSESLFRRITQAIASFL